MDLDQILFGLDPFVNECETDSLKSDTVFIDSYRTLLDQLAVKLRDPDVRDDELIRANLSKFVTACDYLVPKSENNGQFRTLLMELIRVLANAIADNGFNRNILISNEDFIHHLGDQLANNFDDDELNQRILILLKNLVIDSPEIAETLSKLITTKLIIYLGYEDTFMAIDLLTDLIQFHSYPQDFKIVQSFIKKFNYFVENKESFEDDELSELLVNTSIILEQITFDPRLNFTDEYYEISTQKSLLHTLSTIKTIEFANRITAQRRLFASIGNVSANPTSSNKPLVELALSNIHDPLQEDGYIISSSLAILGNAISSSEDRDSILEKSPALISKVLSKYPIFIDPVQFQGVLHILKNVISFGTIYEVFGPLENFQNFELLIEATVRNSRYYTNFTSLLTGFLKKFIVLLGKSQIEIISKSSFPKSLLSSDSNYETNLILLLYLNKVAIYSSIAEIDEIIERILKFTSGNIPLNYLFELTKTLGVLLQHKPEYMLKNHQDEISTLLTTIKSINSDNNDNAIKAVQNNSRYIAGSLINLSKDHKIDEELIGLSKELLKDA